MMVSPRGERMKKFTIIVCIGLCGGVEVECGALFVVGWRMQEEVAPLWPRALWLAVAEDRAL